MKFTKEQGTGRSICRECPYTDREGKNYRYQRRKNIPRGALAYHLQSEDASGEVNIYLCEQHALEFLDMITTTIKEDL